jgi:hypothetical protein
MVDRVFRQPPFTPRVGQRKSSDDPAELLPEDVFVVLDRLALFVDVLAIRCGR